MTVRLLSLKLKGIICIYNRAKILFPDGGTLRVRATRTAITRVREQRGTTLHNVYCVAPPVCLTEYHARDWE